MIQLTWRQFRLPLLFGAGILVLATVGILVTGHSMFSDWDLTVAPCKSNCTSVQQTFSTEFVKLQPWIEAAILVLPGVLGAFWGAPLIARELETGTYRLAWTQGVKRERWLLVKVSLVGLCTAVFAGAVSLLVTWWFSLLDSLNQTPFSVFDHRDLAPIGYSFFAFALGVTAGLVLRRVIPAMVATLAGFIGLRLADWTWLRPNLLSPAVKSGPLTAFTPSGLGSLSPGDWLISENTVNAAGQVVGHNGGIGPDGALGLSLTPPHGVSLAGYGSCPDVVPPNIVPVPGRGKARVFSRDQFQQMQDAVQKCINELHLKDVVMYQPQNRYWTFQWLELAIWMAAGVAFLGFSLWWLKRRLA